MNPWTHNNINFTETPEDLFGFIYKITLIQEIPEYSINTIYIGKKQFHSSRRKLITKKEKLQSPTRKKYKTVTQESDWKTYFSSCTEIHDLIKKYGNQIFKREILTFTLNKYSHSFSEIEQQIKHNVHLVPSFNGIIGKYYLSKLNFI